MRIAEADVPFLKGWLVQRLEDISDADSDVLADYVLALVRSEEEDESIRENCLSNLEDFLREHTASFVDEILNVIRTRAYHPDAAAQQQSAPAAAAAPTAPSASASTFNPAASAFVPSGPSFNPPTGPSAEANAHAPLGSLQNGQSRKRGFNDREGSQPHDSKDPHYGRDNRQMKQMRRGGGAGGGRGGFGGARHGGFPGQDLGMAAFGQQPMGIPAGPPGFPPLDPSNPLAAIIMMQQMGLAPPGIPPIPMPGAADVLPKRTGERCRDYDIKGFCALGANCPYEHGPTAEEYDPSRASEGLLQASGRMNGHQHSDRGGRGRGRGGRGDYRGGGAGFTPRNRAPFSSTQPNFDRSNTSIVVEQIPEEKFSEEAVREFFSEFGTIQEVTMQNNQRRLAIVKYEDWASAKKAYESPKVVFDNRFVKVYWYRPEQQQQGHRPRARSEGVTEKKDEEMIDPEVFAQQQMEKQRQMEERQRKLKENEEKKKELERKMLEQAVESRRLMERLRAKIGQSATPEQQQQQASSANGGAADADHEMREGSDSGTPKPSSQTEALKAKLAELEAEARSMGLSTAVDDASATGGWAPRGRGGFRGRGRGVPPFAAARGRGRGRAGAFVGATRGGVKRLDNRPRRVAVGGVPVGGEKDEGLREYLFNNFDFEAIEPHPEKPDTQVVVFKERYVAENFISQAAREIPKVGKVDLSWVANPPLAVGPAVSSPNASGGTDTAMAGAESTNGGAAGTGPGHAATAAAASSKAEMEYDVDVVEEGEDRWAA